MNKARKERSSEDSTRDRTLGAMRSPSADRTNGVPGPTLPVVDEDGEANSREDSMHNEKAAGYHLRAEPAIPPSEGRPPPTPPKDYAPRNKELPSIPPMPRLSMTEALKAGQ